MMDIQLMNPDLFLIACNKRLSWLPIPFVRRWSFGLLSLHVDDVLDLFLCLRRNNPVQNIDETFKHSVPKNKLRTEINKSERSLDSRTGHCIDLAVVINKPLWPEIMQLHYSNLYQLVCVPWQFWRSHGLLPKMAPIPRNENRPSDIKTKILGVVRSRCHKSCEIVSHCPHCIHSQKNGIYWEYAHSSTWPSLHWRTNTRYRSTHRPGDWRIPFQRRHPHDCQWSCQDLSTKVPRRTAMHATTTLELGSRQVSDWCHVQCWRIINGLGIGSLIGHIIIIILWYVWASSYWWNPKHFSSIALFLHLSRDESQFLSYWKRGVWRNYCRSRNVLVGPNQPELHYVFLIWRSWWV